MPRCFEGDEVPVGRVHSGVEVLHVKATVDHADPPQAECTDLDIVANPASLLRLTQHLAKG